LFRIDNIE